MKLLKCKLCGGEVDIVGNERAVNKKVKCNQCGFNNLDEQEKKPPVIILKKRKFS